MQLTFCRVGPSIERIGPLAINLAFGYNVPRLVFSMLV